MPGQRSPVAVAGAESFACPTCKAPAGQSCVSTWDLPTKLHESRALLHLHQIQDQVRAARQKEAARRALEGRD